MVELVFYKDGEEIRKMSGDGVVAASSDEKKRGFAIIGEFSAEELLRLMSKMTVEITREAFKTEEGSPADSFIINMLIAAIKAEADHANMEEVKE